MTFVALLIRDWPTGAAANDLLAQLLAVAPRAAIAPSSNLAWLDARGLDPRALVARAREALAEIGVCEVTAGAANVPSVARIAAAMRPAAPEEHAVRHAPPEVNSAGIPGLLAEPSIRAARRTAQLLFPVPPGTERRFLAPLPLDVLSPPPRLMSLFASVGLVSCGDLARLTRESVEVRFGRDGLAAWKCARADDPRPIFSARPRELPTASLDWTEFATTDLEQLIFVLHSLLKTVCDTLLLEGVGARSLTLTLTLENRSTIVQPVGSARSTGQRTIWLRLMRRALERITLPDRVTGVAIQVDATGAPAVRQGDLFDLGFASAHAAERAVEHVMDLQGDAVVRLERSEHALLERRAKWVADQGEEHAVRHAEAAMRPAPPRVSSARSPGTPAEFTPGGAGRTALLAPTLHPQLLPAPREISVTTITRRGFATPIRYTDNSVPWSLKESLGPHCISGDRWTERVAREYHQGVRSDGVIVLLYRDVLTDQWYLAGWWD
jgi:hypothetical protein